MNKSIQNPSYQKSESFAQIERLLAYFEAAGVQHLLIEEATRFAGKVVFASDEHVLQRTGERSVTVHWTMYLRQTPQKGDYAIITYQKHSGELYREKAIDTRIIKIVR